MSIPHVDLSCEQCGLIGSTLVTFGIFRYVTPVGSIMLPRELGWCEACKKPSVVEDMSVEARKKDLLADLELTRKNITLKNSTFQKILRFLNRWLTKDRKHSNYYKDLVEREHFLAEELQTPKFLKEYLLAARKPRCLCCGSDNLIKMPDLPRGLNDFYDERRVKVPIGMVHPGCNGALLASTSTMRLHIRFVERKFDLDGNSVE